MSDTPRTDSCWDDESCNILIHARQLERDLAEANTVSATLLTTKCRELAEVTKQRDDLLESLKEVIPYIVGDRCVPWKKAQDAIDRATEGGAQ